MFHSTVIPNYGTFFATISLDRKYLAKVFLQSFKRLMCLVLNYFDELYNTDNMKCTIVFMANDFMAD